MRQTIAEQQVLIDAYRAKLAKADAEIAALRELVVTLERQAATSDELADAAFVASWPSVAHELAVNIDIVLPAVAD